MKNVKLKKYDYNNFKIVDNGSIVATIRDMDFGEWKLTDRADKPLTEQTFETPKAAFEWFKANR